MPETKPKTHTGDFVCVVCPTSCLITAEWNETEVLTITNNQCKLAWNYIPGEIFDPRRTVTTTVTVEHGDMPLVSVKTDKPVPKGMMLDVMDDLADVTVQAPLEVGDVILKDVSGTGSNIISTKRIRRSSATPSFSQIS